MQQRKIVVVKLSGEAFKGASLDIYDNKFVARLAKEVAEARAEGNELVIVVGGGNIWRGDTGKAAGMDDGEADTMGMLATIINAVALRNALVQAGVESRAMSSLSARGACEDYIRPRAIRHLEKGRVVVLAGGTGNPHCTTDFAGALRAADFNADLLIKGTHGDVAGVYDADPRIQKDARMFLRVPFKVVLDSDLEVMDTEAISLCRRRDMPVRVCNIVQPGSLGRALRGEIGTLVSNDPEVVMVDI